MAAARLIARRCLAGIIEVTDRAVQRLIARRHQRAVFLVQVPAQALTEQRPVRALFFVTTRHAACRSARWIRSAATRCKGVRSMSSVRPKRASFASETHPPHANLLVSDALN